MGMPHRSVNVRLQPQLAEAFKGLCEAVDLPKAVIMRALLQDQLLGRSLEEQIEIVTKQIFKPGTKKTNRIDAMNSQGLARNRSKT